MVCLVGLLLIEFGDIWIGTRFYEGDNLTGSSYSRTFWRLCVGQPAASWWEIGVIRSHQRIYLTPGEKRQKSWNTHDSWNGLVDTTSKNFQNICEKMYKCHQNWKEIKHKLLYIQIRKRKGKLWSVVTTSKDLFFTTRTKFIQEQYKNSFYLNIFPSSSHLLPTYTEFCAHKHNKKGQERVSEYFSYVITTTTTPVDDPNLISFVLPATMTIFRDTLWELIKNYQAGDFCLVFFFVRVEP